MQRGDKLRVGYIANNVSIWGGVNQPGVIEYKTGETVDRLVDLAGGITHDAQNDRIKVVHHIDKNTLDETIYAYSDISLVTLEPGDMVYVLSNHSFEPNNTIMIDGKVKYPGPYQIQFGISTIFDVIKMAGGYAHLADSNRIMLKNINLPQAKINKIEKSSNYFTAADVSWMSHMVTATNRQASIQIDKENFAHYSLNPGDQLIVLPQFNFVEIMGAVENSGRFDYAPGTTVEHYINLAGGWEKYAQHKPYIIKSGSSERIPVNSKTIVERGDLIFIPHEIEYNQWERFKDWMTVTSQIGTLILILQNVIQ